MEFVLPEYDMSWQKAMADADMGAVLSEDEIWSRTDGYRSVSRVSAGQALRFAVSNLPQLTSLELVSVDLEDAEQQTFRLFHSWKHLR